MSAKIQPLMWRHLFRQGKKMYPKICKQQVQHLVAPRSLRQCLAITSLGTYRFHSSLHKLFTSPSVLMSTLYTFLFSQCHKIIQYSEQCMHLIRLYVVGQYAVKYPITSWFLFSGRNQNTVNQNLGFQIAVF